MVYTTTFWGICEKSPHLHFAFLFSGMLQEDLSLALVWKWNVRPGLRPDEAYQWPSGPGATKDLIEVMMLEVLVGFPGH